VGEGLFRRCPDDQRTIGDGGHEAGVPRCVAVSPVSGSRRRVYEWQRTGKAKQPYCFEVNEGEPFAFAGIWERWKDQDGNSVETCSILTTGPNAVTAAVHDRMPVVLDPDNYDMWLDPGMKDAETAAEMLKPCDARLMSCYPISTRINNVANDDEGCAARVELEATHLQARLF
jgi:putative SOS response-associated peptidase YedK